MRRSWRWAWAILDPQVRPQDVDAARTALFEQLASAVVEIDGRAGIPLCFDAVTGETVGSHRQRWHALMGFTGRNTDLAWYLLREAGRLDDEKDGRYRRLATAILDTFTTLPASPPAGEGIDLETGRPVSSAPHQARDDVMLLRGIAEGGKSMIRAWRHEADRGRRHPEWLRWARELADWLMEQQRGDGSFPRSWLLASDTVAMESGFSSYNAIPFLVETHAATGEDRYLRAALRCGDYCWKYAGQREGVFVGGTLDNPDVVDKEAGTLSLEAYLALLEATGDERRLEPARAAADFAETWMYVWDARAAGPHWPAGVTTVGAQLIASGHSLVDQYMAFDVGSYAKLFSYTGDPHYRDVARLLLHNTKTMLALPEHPYDLAGPGWQQEHWSFAPPVGEGLHRYWLPWVTCAHLEGIAILEDHDPALARELIAGA